MDKNGFAKEIVLKIKGRMKEKIIEVHEVEKNNGIKQLGLTIREETSNLSPNLYLDQYYARYENGEMSIDDAVDDLISLYDKVSHSACPIGSVPNFVWDEIKDKVILRLVNKELNVELLNKVPHKDFLDLAFTFRLLVSKDDKGMASALLSNTEFVSLGIELEEIFQVAMENTKRLFPQKVSNLLDIISMHFDEELQDDSLWNPKLLVVSNDVGVNGATAIAYSGVMKQVADDLNAEQVYILPSSIHECILVDAKQLDADHAKQMVLEANETVVDPKEILSNSVYMYCTESDKIIKVA